MADSKISELKAEFKKNTDEQKNTSQEIDQLGDKIVSESKKSDARNKDFFVDRIVPNLKKIGQIPKNFAKSISSLSDKIASKTGIKSTADTLGTALKSLLAGLGGVIGVQGFLEGWSKVSDYFGDTAGIQQKLAAGLTGVIDKIFNLTAEQEQKVFDTINGFMQGVVDLFKGFLAWWDESGKEMVGKFITALKALFTGDWETLMDEDKVGKFISGAASFFNKLKDYDWLSLETLALGAITVMAGGFYAIKRATKALIDLAIPDFSKKREARSRGRGAPARTPMGGTSIKPSSTDLPRVVGKTKAGENVVRSSKGNLVVQGADGKGTTRKVSPDDLMKVGRFAKFLKVLGPLGLGFGAVEMAAILNSDMTMGEKQKAIAKSIAGILGGVGGAAAGAALGTLVPIPVVGTVGGGILGGLVGMLGAEAAAGAITDWLFGGDSLKQLGDAVGSTTSSTNVSPSPSTSSIVTATPPPPQVAVESGGANTNAAPLSTGNIGVAVAGDTNNIGISMGTGVRGMDIEIMTVSP